MNKDKTKKSMESFLTSDYFDPNQKQTSSELKIIKNYELNAPYSYANILYDENDSSYQYQIDEIQLNHEEQEIFNKLYNLLEENIDSSKNTKGGNFEQFLTQIIEENEKLFQRYAVAGLEKVKYYLRRDIAGFPACCRCLPGVRRRDG